MHGKMKLRPWEILRMTPPEMILALDDDISKREPPEGAKPFALGQEEAIAERYRNMTAIERYREAIDS
jgi:hypothetical protein